MKETSKRPYIVGHWSPAVHADTVVQYDKAGALVYWGGEFRKVGEAVGDMFTT